MSGYAVLYAAVSFETCVIETLVRDRFARRSQRELPLTAILVRAWSHIATRPECMLNLLDLRGSGCLEIGAPTDAAQPGRRWGARCMKSIETSMDSFTPPDSRAMTALQCLIAPSISSR